jgi:transcriptional repressor BetI
LLENVHRPADYRTLPADYGKKAASDLNGMTITSTARRKRNIAGRRGSGEPARFSREQPEVRRRQLIEAAIRVIARGGIQAFTIDRICREAGVSKGLVGHYFDGKDALLAAVYRTSLYEPVMAQLATVTEGMSATTRLQSLIDTNFTDTVFDKSNLLVWLSLWGEAATNAALNREHRTLYGALRRALAEAMAAVAAERGVTVDAEAMARNLIALIDGLWLEWSIDDTALDPAAARAACHEFVEAKLGPL